MYIVDRKTKAWSLTRKYLGKRASRMYRRAFIRYSRPYYSPEFTKPAFQTIHFAGESFDVKLDPDNGKIDEQIYKFKIHEPELGELYKQYITDTSICLNIGAHVGYTTMCMSLLARHGTVHAFEPIPRLAEMQRETLARNHVTNVQLHQLGVGSTTATLPMHLDNLHVSRSTFARTNEIDSSTLHVGVVAIDDYLSGLTRLDFVRIDTEGYEYHCVLGMASLIRKYRPTMAIEYSPYFLNFTDEPNDSLLNYLLDEGYTIRDVPTGVTVTPENMSDYVRSIRLQTDLLCT